MNGKPAPNDSRSPWDPKQLAAALAQDGDAEGAWAQVAQLDGSGAETLIVALKAELDREVRVSPPKALTLAETLVKAAQGQAPRLLALARRGRAVALHFNSQNAASHGEFIAAAEAHLAAGEPLEAAIAWRSLVEVCHQLGRREEAFEHADRARVTFVELEAHQLLSELELNVGNLLVRLDEYPAAETAYARALAGFERLEHALGVTFCQFNLAVVAMNLSELDRAEERWLLARDGMQAAGHQLHVADCDYNLAYLLSRSGDFRRAIEELESARAGYLVSGKPSGMPLCDLDLAEIYLRLGAFEPAAERAAQAIEAFGDLGLPLELGRAQLILALTGARRGETSQTQALFESARARFLEVGNQNSAAIVELELAALEIEHGKAGEALQRASAAREEFDARQLKLLSGFASLVAARAAAALGDPARALVELERLNSLSERQGLGGLVHLERLCLSARVENLLGRPDEAIARLRAALEHIDSTYPAIPGQEVRLAFLKEQHAAFVDLVFLLARRNRPGDGGEALAVLEEGRVHTSEGRALELSLAEPEVRRARQRIALLLARRLESELDWTAGGTQVRGAGPDDGQLEAAWRDYRRARPARAKERDRMRVDRELLARACPPGERLVAYALDRRGCVALVAEGGRVRAHGLQTDALELAGHIDRLRFHMDRLRLGGEFLGARSRQFERASDALFDGFGDRLLAPLFDFDDDRPITILPYGLLHDLPFHAFRVAGKALIERAEVGYAPGLTSLLEARERRYPEGAPLLLMDAGGSGLSETRAELCELETLYPGHTRRLPLTGLVGPAAQHIPLGAALHVAGHGLFVPEQPQFSALSDGEQFLFAHELVNQTLPLSLVVLSGCETGRQGSVEAEELISLNRAFLAAGAQAVLASLWPVEDHLARCFMVDFYRSLSEGQGVRSALARVQRAWHGGISPSAAALSGPAGKNEPMALQLPHVWAAFSLNGSPQVRFPAPAPPVPQ